MTDQPAIDVIRCPKCGSTNWTCCDERNLDCWHPDGTVAGVKVVGYLECRACYARWTDVAGAPDAPCECEEE